MNCIRSAFLRIDWKDIKKGVGLAVAAAGTFLFSQMAIGTIPTAEIWQSTGSVFIGTLGVYLTKNFSF